MLREIAEKFIAWTKLKIIIQDKNPQEVERVYFREREVWWVHLGKISVLKKMVKAKIFRGQ